MTTPTDNHRLELVGGEWEETVPNFFRRKACGYRAEVWKAVTSGYWIWGVLEDSEHVDTNTAPTREAAIAAAEAALLEEIGKFVRVRL